MHCNFICGLSDVIIKTFSQSVDTLEPHKPWVLMHRVGATPGGLQSSIWTGRNGTAVQFSLVRRLWTLLNGFFAVHELNWGLLFWTRVCVSNGSVFTAHELADVRLVSLQPIKSWRWRAWPMNASCNWVDLLRVSSVQFSSCAVNKS